MATLQEGLDQQVERLQEEEIERAATRIATNDLLGTTSHTVIADDIEEPDPESGVFLPPNMAHIAHRGITFICKI